MVQTITLPRVVVTRSAARDVVRQASLTQGGDTVKVLARAVASSAQSFADELVEQLVANGFHSALLLGAPRQLAKDMETSAKRAGSLRILTNEAGLVAS